MRLHFFYRILFFPHAPFPLLDYGRSLWIVPYQNHSMAKIWISECNKEVGASPTQFMIKNKTQQNSSKQLNSCFINQIFWIPKLTLIFSVKNGLTKLCFHNCSKPRIQIFSSWTSNMTSIKTACPDTFDNWLKCKRNSSRLY